MESRTCTGECCLVTCLRRRSELMKIIGNHTNGAHRPQVHSVMIRWKVCEVWTGDLVTKAGGGRLGARRRGSFGCGSAGRLVCSVHW